jgi:5-(carboxyamino)imidazole ribonucleotide synthase
MPIIAPGSTIGILGGGQLGRMTAMAARSLGYHVHVLDPDAECAASPVADRVVAAKFSDADAAADLARHCDVVTLEIEQIGVDALRRNTTRPFGPARNPRRDSRSLSAGWRSAVPIGPYRDVTTAAELADDACVRGGGGLFVKLITADTTAGVKRGWRGVNDADAMGVARRGRQSRSKHSSSGTRSP